MTNSQTDPVPDIGNAGRRAQVFLVLGCGGYRLAATATDRDVFFHAVASALECAKARPHGWPLHQFGTLAERMATLMPVEPSEPREYVETVGTVTDAEKPQLLGYVRPQGTGWVTGGCSYDHDTQTLRKANESPVYLSHRGADC